MVPNVKHELSLQEQRSWDQKLVTTLSVNVDHGLSLVAYKGFSLIPTPQNLKIMDLQEVGKPNCTSNKCDFVMWTKVQTILHQLN